MKQRNKLVTVKTFPFYSVSPYRDLMAVTMEKKNSKREFSLYILKFNFNFFFFLRYYLYKAFESGEVV